MNMYKHLILVTFILFLIANVACQQWYEVGNPHFLDTNNVFDSIKQPNTIKILKFFSPWCKYCRYIKSYVDNYKSTYSISPNLKFYEFNCQSNGPMFCFQHFQVGSYPAVIVFNENGQRITRIDGLYPQQVIVNILTQYNQKAHKLGQISHQHKKEQEPKKQQSQQAEQPKTQQTSNEHKEEIANKQQKQQTQKKVQEEKPQGQVKIQQNEPKEAQNKSKQSQVNPKQQQTKPQIVQNKPKQQQPRKVEQQNKQKEKEISQQKQKTPAIVEKKQEKVEVVQMETNKIDSEKQTIVIEQKNEEGSHWFKYMMYVGALVVGGTYAYRIFLTKQEQNQRNTKNSSHRQNPTPSKPHIPNRVISRDIQNEILNEEILDENL